MALLSLVFSLLICGTPALAGDNKTEDDFRQNAQALPRLMLKYGYRRLGKIDTSELLNRMERTKVTVAKNLDGTRTSGNSTNLRNSAHWRRGPGGAEITLHGPNWRKTDAKLKPLVALHENLGALGYTDHDFTCTNTIWLLTNSTARKNLTREELGDLEEIGRRNCLLAAGGSTGVTGGGDKNNVQGKVVIFEENLKKLARINSRQERRDVMEDIFSLLFLGFEKSEGFKAKEPGNFDASSVMLLRSWPVSSSIRVEVNGKPIPRSRKHGWSYDRKESCDGIPCIRFHGKYKTVLHMTSVLFQSER